MCLHYGASASSAEIVGVALELEAHGWGGDHMVVEPVPLAVSDRRLAGREVHSDLRVRIARAVPPGERIGTKRLFPFELEQPAAAVGLAGLSRPPVELGYAGNGHRSLTWQTAPSKSTRPPSLHANSNYGTALVLPRTDGGGS